MTDQTFIRHNCFNMLKKIQRTRLNATNAGVHKRIHTNFTTMDDEHIPMVTNFTQVLFASTRKLTLGFVRLCVINKICFFVFRFKHDVLGITLCIWAAL